MNTKKIKKAVILVAGLGTRCLPATKAVTKEMLPVVDKPVVQYLVEEAAASGIREIIFVTGKKSDILRNHFTFDRGLDKALRMRKKTLMADMLKDISGLARYSFVEQREPKGPGHALLLARRLVRDEPVVVFYNDDLVSAAVPCARQLMDAYTEYGAPVLALARIPKRDAPRYGMVDASRIGSGRWSIRGIVEKPSIDAAPSTLMSYGRYIYTPELLDALSGMSAGPNGEYWPTDCIDAYAKSGNAVYGVEVDGTRYDCGDKFDFLRAAMDFGCAHPEIGAKFRAHMRKRFS